MKRTIKSLFADKQGLALIEFALFLPLLLVMFFGVVEFTRYVIIMQKVERATYSLSNITGQYTPITYKDAPSELDIDALENEIFPQYKKSMEPYTNDVDRIAIITSMSKTGNGNNNNSLTINWQSAGGGSMPSAAGATSILNGVNASAINSKSENGSTAGTHPSFPSYKGQMMDGILSSMATGENMIIVEVFYNYKPIVSGILSRLGATALAQTTLKSTVYSRPRNGDLLTLVRPDPPPVIPPPEKTRNCWTDPIEPPFTSCSTYNNTATCKTTTSCSLRTGTLYCKNCTKTYTSPTASSTSCWTEWWPVSGPATTTVTDTPGCVVEAPKPAPAPAPPPPPAQMPPPPPS